MCMYMHIYMYYLQTLKGTRDKDPPKAMSIPRYWSLIPFPTKKNQGFSKKCLILGTGQDRNRKPYLLCQK